MSLVIKRRYIRAAFESVRALEVPAASQDQVLDEMKSLPSPYMDIRSHCRASYAAISSKLPPEILASIYEFRTASAPVALLIKRLPMDSLLPPTPTRGEWSVNKKSFVSEGCLTGIAQLLGEQISYASEKNGELIHNICPVQHRETTQSNESSRAQLHLHVENAYFDDRPDFLALYCIRQDHKRDTLTFLADARSALLKLDAGDVRELQKRAFVVPSPQSHHKTMGGERWSAPRPLIENHDDLKLICHFPGIKALNGRAQEALNKFEQAVHRLDVVHKIAIEPGNVLLINNNKAAHGRSYFEPRYDGLDRWLQRVYVKAFHNTGAM